MMASGAAACATRCAIGAAAQAGQALVEGERVAAAQEGIVVSVIAILATFALLAFQRYVLARTGSLAIHADHVHYQSDLLLNVAVIAALVRSEVRKAASTRLWWALLVPAAVLSVLVGVFSGVFTLALGVPPDAGASLPLTLASLAYGLAVAAVVAGFGACGCAGCGCAGCGCC